MCTLTLSPRFGKQKKSYGTRCIDGFNLFDSPRSSSSPVKPDPMVIRQEMNVDTGCGGSVVIF